MRIFIADLNPQTAAIVRGAYPDADVQGMMSWDGAAGEARAFRADIVVVAPPAEDPASVLPFLHHVRNAPEVADALVVAIVDDAVRPFVPHMTQGGVNGFSGMPFDPTILRPYMERAAHTDVQVAVEEITLDTEDSIDTADDDDDNTPVHETDVEGAATQLDIATGGVAQASTQPIAAPVIPTDDGELLRTLSRLEALLSLVTTTPGSMEALQIFVERCGSMLLADRAVLYAFAADSDLLLRMADSREPGAGPEQVGQDADPALQAILQTGRPLRIDNTESPAAYQALGGPAPYGSVLGSPLLVHGSAAGALLLINDRPREPTPVQEALTGCMAQAAAAMLSATTLLDRINTAQLATIELKGQGAARVGLNTGVPPSLDKHVDEMLRELNLK